MVSLPFFWDEAGYYVPAAHEFFTRGAPVPSGVPSSGHPPLLSIYVSALWWIFGEGIESVRVGMLAVSVVGLWSVFRLGRVLGSPKLGLAAAVCTACYPCYFTQSTMALADLPSAAFTILGLSDYFEGKKRAGVWFCVAAAFKETAILVPLGLLIADFADSGRRRSHLFYTAPPVALLAVWYAFHWGQTGAIFGNPEFARYNLAQNMALSRIAAALPMRIWQAFGHLGMALLTASAVVAILRGGRSALPRPVAIRLAVLVGVHLAAFSVLGGALLTRYLLPVVPLIVLACLSCVKRTGLVAGVAAAWFLVNLTAQLPYHHPAEENLAYRDFVLAHWDAARFLEREHPNARIATGWPADFHLSMPVLGYVRRPLAVVPMDRPDADFALVFNRDYAPPESWMRPGRILRKLAWWRSSSEWFGASATATPELERKVYREWRRGSFHVRLVRRR